MGLIADIVESVVGAIKTGGSWALEPRGTVKDELNKMARIIMSANPGLMPLKFTIDDDAAESWFEQSLQNMEDFTDDPGEFIEELFLKWAKGMNEVYARLNVEVSEQGIEALGSVEAQIGRKLEMGVTESQTRLAGALTIINTIVIGGNAASIVAEASSLGVIRSIAEMIQSFIWANGLGSFTPLAFTPQMQASLNPYLQRHYNSRATAQLPPVTDIIRFQLREVFLAGRREELVGDEARPVYDQAMKEWGFDKFWADSYWGAHWQLPSISQLNEMLFRGVISRETWESYVRFNDFVPAQIDNLARISYSPFTRVDSRRMYRLGVLTDQELLQSYADVGYFADTEETSDGSYKARFTGSSDYSTYKAEALVLFTKIFNQVPELRQRYSKGWISAEEVLAELVATGIPTERAEALYQTIVKNDAEARIAPERELTRGLIARAWKLREISFPQATYLLTRIGWSVPEAELILRVQSQPDDPLAMVPTNLGIRLGATIGEAVEPSEFLEL